MKWFFVEVSASTWIQLPKARRDRFIFAPSSCRLPFWQDFYDPARSTRVNFPIFDSYFSPCALSFDSAFTIKRACEREEASFDAVASFDLFAAPTFKTVDNSSIVEIAISVTPEICIPSLGSSLNSKFLSKFHKNYLLR